MRKRNLFVRVSAFVMAALLAGMAVPADVQAVTVSLNEPTVIADAPVEETGSEGESSVEKTEDGSVVEDTEEIGSAENAAEGSFSIHVVSHVIATERKDALSFSMQLLEGDEAGVSYPCLDAGSDDITVDGVEDDGTASAPIAYLPLSGDAEGDFNNIGFWSPGHYVFEIKADRVPDIYRKDTRVWTVAVDVADDLSVTNAVYSRDGIVQDTEEVSFISVCTKVDGFDRQTLEAADRLMATMTAEEKAGQMILFHYPKDGAGTAAQAKDILDKYHVGGFLVFAAMFPDNTTPAAVQAKIAQAQADSKIPLLFTVDEEGGRVVRVTKNPGFYAQLEGITEPFQTPSVLKKNGGLDAVRADAVKKAGMLKSLGLNVNHNPVADVVPESLSSAFIYQRAWQEDGVGTADYVRAVVEATEGSGIGTTMKHFPGYGSTSSDTHNGFAVNDLPMESFLYNDLLPFQEGMAAGSHSVMVTHNTINAFDTENPSSLSPAVYSHLRNEMHFDGVAMTDDLVMGAITNFVGEGQASLRALQAGADMAMTSSEADVQNVVAAVKNGTLSEEQVNEKVRRILAWKIDLGLIDPADIPEVEAEAGYFDMSGNLKAEGRFLDMFEKAKTGDGKIVLYTDVTFDKQLNLIDSDGLDVTLDLAGHNLHYAGTGKGIVVSSIPIKNASGGVIGAYRAKFKITDSIGAITEVCLGTSVREEYKDYILRYNKCIDDKFVGYEVDFSNVGSITANSVQKLLESDGAWITLENGVLENVNGSCAIQDVSNGMATSFTMSGGAILGCGNGSMNGGAIHITGWSSNIIMSGGYMAGNYGSNGGAIQFNENSSMDLQKGVIACNKAKRGGGGIYMSGFDTTNTHRADLKMDDVIISGNVTETLGGGGIYANGRCGLIMTDKSYIMNNCSEIGGGGFVNQTDNNIDTNVFIKGGNIIGNYSKTVGGGVYFYYYKNKSHTYSVEDVIIKDNTADHEGGGLGIVAAADMNLCEGTVKNCEIVDNQSAQQGGGIYLKRNVAMSLQDTVVSGNKASHGGGICHEGQELALNKNVTVKNNRAVKEEGVTVLSDTADFGNYGEEVPSDSDRNNIYLPAGKMLQLNGGRTGIDVGVTLERYPDEKGLVDVAKGYGKSVLSTEYLGCVTPDNENYQSILHDGKIAVGSILFDVTLIEDPTAEAAFIDSAGTVQAEGTFDDMWAEAKKAKKGTVKLYKDVTWGIKDDTWAAKVVAAGEDITLDLAGHTASFIGPVNGAVNSGSAGIYVRGHFTLDDSAGFVKVTELDAPVVKPSYHDYVLRYNDVFYKDSSEDDVDQKGIEADFNGMGLLSGNGVGALIFLPECTEDKKAVFTLKNGMMENRCGGHVVRAGNYQTVEILGGAIVGSGKPTEEYGENWNKWSTGAVIFNPGDGIFKMSGGYICGNETYIGCAGVATSVRTTVDISGGVIACNKNDAGGGAAIRLEAESSAVIKNAVITGNSSKTSGNIFSLLNSTLHIENSQITYNTAVNQGGGICVQDGTLELSGKSVVAYNEATGTNGGGISLVNSAGQSTGTISDSRIVHNEAKQNGGGIYTAGKVIMSNYVAVSYNHVKQYAGGGIQIAPKGGVTATDGCIVSHNVAEDADAEGGGISIAGNGDIAQMPVLDMTDCIVTGNDATRGCGGGIRQYGCYSNVRLTRCLISENKSYWAGGGIRLVNGSATNAHVVRTRLTDCEMTDNQSGSVGGNIYVDGRHVVLDGTTILSGGIAKASDLGGGGIYITKAWVDLKDHVKIKNNQAVNGDGGGIYVRDAWNNFEGLWQSGLYLSDSVEISGNTAKRNGGGIYLSPECESAMCPVSVDGSVKIKDNSTSAQPQNNVAFGMAGQYVTAAGTLSSDAEVHIWTARNKHSMDAAIAISDAKAEEQTVNFIPDRPGYDVISDGSSILFVRGEQADIPVYIMIDGNKREIGRIDSIYRDMDTGEKYMVLSDIAAMAESWGFVEAAYKGTPVTALQDAEGTVRVSGDSFQNADGWCIPVPSDTSFDGMALYFLSNGEKAGKTLTEEEIAHDNGYFTVRVNDLFGLSVSGAENASGMFYVPSGSDFNISLPYRSEKWEWWANDHTDKEFRCEMERSEDGRKTVVKLSGIYAPVVLTCGSEGDTKMTVQYFASTKALDMRSSTAGGYPMQVLDLSGKEGTASDILKNDTAAMTAMLKYLGASTSGADKGQMKTVDKIDRIYEDRDFSYGVTPELYLMDMTTETKDLHFELTELWVLKSGKDPDSRNRADWDIYDAARLKELGIDRIHDLKLVRMREEEKPGSIYVMDNAVFRFVYKGTDEKVSSPVTFYDYDITDGWIYTNYNSMTEANRVPTSQQAALEAAGTNFWVLTSKKGQVVGDGTGEGINSRDNYQMNGKPRLAFGNGDFANMQNQTLDGLKFNQYNRGTNKNIRGCMFGLATGLNADGTIHWNDRVDVADLFQEGAAAGKTELSGYTLDFNREGDVYTLTAVGGTNVRNLETLGNPRYTNYNGTVNNYTHIWTNNFWPADDFATYGTDGHDAKHGDDMNAKLVNQRRMYRTNGGSDVHCNPSDDGKDHNGFFGFHTEIGFSIPEGYVGDLEYLFYGDDDLFVFLCDEDYGNARLIADTGGVHSAVGEYVNLWDYIDQSDETARDKNYKLVIYYLERGASGSTCYMRFSLPDVEFARGTEQQETSLVVQKDVVSYDEADPKEFSFHLSVTDENDEPVSDYITYRTMSAEGAVIDYGVFAEGVYDFKLKDDEQMVFTGIPLHADAVVVSEDVYPDCQTRIDATGMDRTEGTEIRKDIIPYAENKILFTNDFSGKIVLPDTGGEGTAWLYFAGTMVVIAGASLYAAYRKRKMTAA